MQFFQQAEMRLQIIQRILLQKLFQVFIKMAMVIIAIQGMIKVFG
jgi:hypothetical protein